MKITRSWIIFSLAVSLAVLAVARFSSRTATVIAENMPIQRDVTVIIDAGHGGEDGGAISCTGTAESRINLEIALCLNDLFNLMGYDTYMIRTTDTSVYTKGETLSQKKISDLKERVRIVDEMKNAVLLSIHQNTFPDGKYSGAQVFYGNEKAGMILAKQMQNSFVESLNPGSRRQCKAAKGIYLMEQITCPAVLIECGFLSNAEEEAKLRTKAYQQQICCVIAANTSVWLKDDIVEADDVYGVAS